MQIHSANTPQLLTHERLGGTGKVSIEGFVVIWCKGKDYAGLATTAISATAIRAQ